MNRQFLFDNCQNKIQPDLKVYEGRKSWNIIFIAKRHSLKAQYQKKTTEKEKYQELL